MLFLCAGHAVPEENCLTVKVFEAITALPNLMAVYLFGIVHIAVLSIMGCIPLQGIGEIADSAVVNRHAVVAVTLVVMDRN